MRVARLVRSSKRTAYPTSRPSSASISQATRRATVTAACAGRLRRDEREWGLEGGRLGVHAVQGVAAAPATQRGPRISPPLRCCPHAPRGAAASRQSRLPPQTLPLPGSERFAWSCRCPSLQSPPSPGWPAPAGGRSACRGGCSGALAPPASSSTARHRRRQAAAGNRQQAAGRRLHQAPPPGRTESTICCWYLRMGSRICAARRSLVASLQITGGGSHPTALRVLSSCRRRPPQQRCGGGGSALAWRLVRKHLAPLVRPLRAGPTPLRLLRAGPLRYPRRWPGVQLL